MGPQYQVLSFTCRRKHSRSPKHCTTLKVNNGQTPKKNPFTKTTHDRQSPKNSLSQFAFRVAIPLLRVTQYRYSFKAATWSLSRTYFIRYWSTNWSSISDRSKICCLLKESETHSAPSSMATGDSPGLMQPRRENDHLHLETRWRICAATTLPSTLARNVYMMWR